MLFRHGLLCGILVSCSSANPAAWIPLVLGKHGPSRPPAQHGMGQLAPTCPLRPFFQLIWTGSTLTWCRAWSVRLKPFMQQMHAYAYKKKGNLTVGKISDDCSMSHTVWNKLYLVRTLFKPFCLPRKMTCLLSSPEIFSLSHYVLRFLPEGKSLILPHKRQKCH